MQTAEVSAEEYGAFFADCPHIYNNAAFNILNSHKADAVRFVLMRDEKVRFGIVLGERCGSLLSPFSAPFGGLSYNRTQTFERVDDAVSTLARYAREKAMTVRVTLPPPVYGATMTPLLASALLRRGTLLCAEVNWHFVLSDYADYASALDRNGKNKLRQASREHFDFIIVDNNRTDDVKRAYAVIKRNRDDHGYPLRMSEEDVVRTIAVVPADLFLLIYKGEDVAAALVYHAAKNVRQVIYWGAPKEYSALRPMNALACRIFEHYFNAGARVLDVGPATENGVPNYGLCEFKKSIGCRPTLKYIFELS